MSIVTTYKSIQERFPHVPIDSLAVVKQVEEYRRLWKPKETKVVLLAESHVYTDKQDYQVECNGLVMDKIIPNYPLHFVRFVYCLGYGENQILERAIKKNTGTPQFWKIFSSCIAEDERALGFHKVLKTGTPSLLQRLKNKINVLQKMREKGIWLLDSSIVGLYRSGIDNPEIRKRIIEICWKNHLEKVIKESNPEHIMVVGKGVKDILGLKLCKLGFYSERITTMPLPQGARGSSQEQLENYKKYQRICAKVIG